MNTSHKTNHSKLPKLHGKFTRAVHSIPENPWLGRLIPELDRHDCRERIHGRYRIAYLVKAEEIDILTIWHSARRLPEILARLQG
jgi:plasmid stabilization system protein ParE